VSYLVLARKWRPQTFDEVLGQEAIVRTLKNAIVQDRVAHAFLFSGPRGVGKTTLARVLAKALNCQSFDKPTVTPCGKCAACVEIAEGSAVDVLEIDGASNRGIDNIRDLRETVRYLPASCRTKIYIIDEVHMLTTESFNALLKTLEEPPPHVMFMFATTEPHKVLPTILSRCQRYDFHRVSTPTLIAHLERICGAEGIKLPLGALAVIAREAEGGVRDSLSLLDQVTSFGAEGLTEDEVLHILGVVDRALVAGICSDVLEGDAAGALGRLYAADEAGYDIKQLEKVLLRWFRNLVVAKVSTDPARLMDVTESELAELQALAAKHSLDTLERLFGQLARLDEELLRTGQPRLLLEMTLVRMANLPRLTPLTELIARLTELEGHLRSGSPIAAPAPEGDSLFPRPAPATPARPAAKPPAPAGARPETWEECMGFVEERDAKLFALLSAGSFVGHSGREWRLSFPPGSAALASLKGEKNADAMRALLGECFGEGHRLILGEDAALTRNSIRTNHYQEAEQRRREAMDDPVIKALQDKLGGEIEEIKVK
jgi:DNA polymerase III subunit gamma/tau